MNPPHYPESGNEWCRDVEESSFWFRHRNACIVELIRRFPPQGPLYDVGGGNGFVSLAIQKAGWETVVVEPGATGAENARARGLNNVICSTFEAAGFKNKSIAAAGLFDVLEHIQDDQAHLSAIRNALLPEGRLFVTVPAYPWLWSTADEYARHFRRYTISTLRESFKPAGFKIDYATYIFAPLVPAVFVLRALPYRMSFSKKVNLEEDARLHRDKPGLAGRALDILLTPEIRAIRNQKIIPFGASLLAAASPV